jgi:hypothetical protein
VASAQASTDAHIDSKQGCAIDVPIADIPWERCTWNSEASGKHVHLLGDSNAGQFSDTVIQAAIDEGRPITVLAANGCPFMDVRSYVDPDPESCAGYVATVLDELGQRPPGTVLIGSSALPYTPPEFADEGTFESGGPGPDRDYLESVLSESITKLKSQGHVVGLLQILPHFSRDPYVYDSAECSLVDILAGSCHIRMPKEFADEMQADMMFAYQSAAELTGASLLDFRDHMCPQEVCSTVEDGRFRYLDGGHISVEESLTLTPFFRDYLRMD